MHPSETDLARCAPLGAESLSDEQARAAAALFKALGDPARVRIINVLATSNAPVCACELEGPTGLSQPTVSHHMKRLVNAGLVRAERQGAWAFYRLDPEACARLCAVCALPPEGCCRGC